MGTLRGPNKQAEEKNWPNLKCGCVRCASMCFVNTEWINILNSFGTSADCLFFVAPKRTLLLLLLAGLLNSAFVILLWKGGRKKQFRLSFRSWQPWNIYIFVYIIYSTRLMWTACILPVSDFPSFFLSFVRIRIRIRISNGYEYEWKGIRSVSIWNKSTCLSLMVELFSTSASENEFLGYICCTCPTPF